MINVPFQDFISSLSEKDKKNFEDYSKIRGEQQYRIIYETDGNHKLNT